MDRPIPNVRIERPDPRRPDCNARSERFVCDQENRNGSERRKEAVDRQQNPRRGVGVDSKYLEHAPHQVGIKRWLPRAGAGVSAIRAAESFAGRYRTRYTAHFPAKAVVVLNGASVVLPEDSDRCDLQKKRKHHHPQNRSGDGRKARSLHHGRVYQVSVCRRFCLSSIPSVVDL